MRGKYLVVMHDLWLLLLTVPVILTKPVTEASYRVEGDSPTRRPHAALGRRDSPGWLSSLAVRTRT